MRPFFVGTIVALLVLGAAAIWGHARLQRRTEAHLQDSALINLAGRQRMLSQRIVQRSVALLGVTRADEATPRRLELDQLLGEFKAAHSRLTAQRAVSDGETAQAQALVQTLTTAYSALLDVVQLELERSPLLPPARVEAAARLEAAGDAFLTAMEAVVADHDRTSAEGIARLVEEHAAMRDVLLGLVVLEAVFLLAPLAFIAHRAQTAQRRAREELAEQLRRTQQEQAERERLAQALEREKALFLALFRAMPTAALLLEDGRCVDCNPAALALYGAERRELLLEKRPFDLAPPYQSDGRTTSAVVNEHLLRLSRDGTSVAFELTATRLGGERFEADVSVASVRLPSSSYVLWLSQDITTRKRDQLTLRATNLVLAEVAVTDALTHIPNRRAFESRLETEWKRAGRSGIPLGILICDIDHFKAYNDHHGHQAGDACLARVAGALSNAVRRAGDFVARYGGEEFVAVIPDATRASVLQVAEKMREQVAALRIPHQAHPDTPFVSISVGVALARGDHRVRHDTLVKAADESLYAAKREGRNRVDLSRIPIESPVPFSTPSAGPDSASS